MSIKTWINGKLKSYFGSIITTEPDGITYQDTYWEDLRFPFMGRNLDTSSGRIDYDYTELGVGYADNSRYADTEQVSMICQLPHSWKLETAVHPHVHWIQNTDFHPNLLMEYRVYKNGSVPPATWTKAKATALMAFSAGALQISGFPAISMTGIDTVSAILDVKLYRDTGNTSAEFAGADPYAGTLLTKEFDIHFEIDTPGSRNELVK